MPAIISLNGKQSDFFTTLGRSGNLAKKEDVIKRMAALEAAGTADDATAEQVRALMKEWNAIGFVPFKEKDRLYKEFHALVDKLFDRLHLSATENA